MLARLTPWVMLIIWSSWAAAAQGLLAQPDRMALWVPDLSLLLLLACAARFDSGDVPKAALVIALGRVAFSVEPPAALLVAFLATSVLVLGVRSVAQVNGAFVRVSLAVVCSWSLGAWLVFVHVVRVQRMGGDAPLSLAFALDLWRGALTTGVAAVLVGPTLAYLPGLTNLRRRQW
ncbi:MAG: hypothetical protein ACI8QZ_002718 [Chlamydiales bacterium]|jgi:hypothetical protein